MEGGTIPVDAMKLANTFSLEIRSMDDCSEIKIFSEPSIKLLNYDKDYRNNRIWSLDITDEFFEMAHGCYIVVDGISHAPKIKEKHCCKFRIRLDGDETKQIELFVNNIKINDFLITAE